MLVVSAGTNDSVDTLATWRREVERVLTVAGPDRCVVWLTIARPKSRGGDPEPFNRALSTLDKDRANLAVVDWAALVRRHPDWLVGDGVHGTLAGMTGRAQAVGRRGLRLLAARPVPPGDPPAGAVGVAGSRVPGHLLDAPIGAASSPRAAQSPTSPATPATSATPTASSTPTASATPSATETATPSPTETATDRDRRPAPPDLAGRAAGLTHAATTRAPACASTRAVSGPAPVWMSSNALRRRAVTGPVWPSPIAQERRVGLHRARPG